MMLCAQPWAQARWHSGSLGFVHSEAMASTDVVGDWLRAMAANGHQRPQEAEAAQRLLRIRPNPVLFLELVGKEELA